MSHANGTALEGALAFIDANFGDHLADLQACLKIDNLITHRERCEEVARLLNGAIDAGAKRTLVVYRNYDIVPPEGADWSAPPFSGRVRTINGLGGCIVSR